MLMKWMYRLGVVLSMSLLFFAFSACHGTMGGVGVDWGHEDENEPASPYGSHRYEDDKPGPPAHAPAHGYRAKHHYRYYPDERVYYDTGRGAYFYLDNGTWRMSVSLPGSIRLESRYVPLELDTDEPYRYFNEHQSKYPPGKMKGKKHKKW